MMKNVILAITAISALTTGLSAQAKCVALESKFYQQDYRYNWPDPVGDENRAQAGTNVRVFSDGRNGANPCLAYHTTRDWVKKPESTTNLWPTSKWSQKGVPGISPP